MILAHFVTKNLDARFYPQEDCAACAGDLPLAYVEAIVYGTEVKCCSGECLADLYIKWEPAKRHVPWSQIAVTLAMALLLHWR